MRIKRDPRVWCEELRPRFVAAGCDGGTLARIYKSTASNQELRALAVDCRAGHIDNRPAWIVGVLQNKGQAPRAEDR